MSGYGHLTFDEREQIAILHALENGPTAIAQAIGRPVCTISRELNRNSNVDGSYRPTSAEGRYMARRQRECILGAHSELATFVLERLYEGWTPEQIAGWLKAGNEKLSFPPIPEPL